MEYKAEVVFDDKQVEQGTMCLRPSHNLFTGESRLSSIFKRLTSLEIDILTFAAAVFACDIAFQRGRNENVIRSIELTVPVINLAKFSTLHDEILFALHKLSDDAWHIEFKQRQGLPETSGADKSHQESGSVLLLSGGLDSFAGALEIGNSSENIHLVSHVTANQVVRYAQKTAYEYLEGIYPGKFAWTQIYVTGRKSADGKYWFPPDNKREDTQRTRSFLFLALAGIIARRKGYRNIIYIAENGQLAINLPLTSARISSFSTHTAHPEFVNCMGEILSSLLSYQIQVINPFAYFTKAELIEPLIVNHLAAAKSTVSCWKASRITGEKTHCGYCVPCLMRRIAVESNGISLDEYARDIFSEDMSSIEPEDDGKRNITDLAEFINIFEIARSKSEILDKHIDLINPYIDSDRAIEMYRRFAKETRAVFNSYPNLKGYMQ